MSPVCNHCQPPVHVSFGVYNCAVWKCDAVLTPLREAGRHTPWFYALVLGRVEGISMFDFCVAEYGQSAFTVFGVDDHAASIRCDDHFHSGHSHEFIAGVQFNNALGIAGHCPCFRLTRLSEFVVDLAEEC